jgi:hypothetical protein
MDSHVSSQFNWVGWLKFNLTYLLVLPMDVNLVWFLGFWAKPPASLIIKENNLYEQLVQKVVFVQAIHVMPHQHVTQYQNKTKAPDYWESDYLRKEKRNKRKMREKKRRKKQRKERGADRKKEEEMPWVGGTCGRPWVGGKAVRVWPWGWKRCEGLAVTGNAVGDGSCFWILFFGFLVFFFVFH